MTFTGAGATAQAATSSAVAGAGLKMPAVDGVNGKVDVLGGSFDNRSLYALRGALSLPLGDQFGLQIDGVVGELGSRSVYGIAGHLFWRDPSQGLLGVYASHARWQRAGGIRLNQIAAEGELYRGPITFRVLAGQESGNSGSAISGPNTETFNIKSRFFGTAGVSFYPTENLKLSAGPALLGGKGALSLGVEWGWPMPRSTMGALFLEGLVGGVSGVWGGIKFYFGQRQKPLIRRHREDDPVINMPSLLFGLTGSLTQMPTPTPPAPAPAPGPDGGET